LNLTQRRSLVIDRLLCCWLKYLSGVVFVILLVVDRVGSLLQAANIVVLRVFEFEGVRKSLPTLIYDA
jgi:hypothetical protein